MGIYLTYLLGIAMLVGHVAIWTWLYNRLHASRLPSRIVQRLEKFVILATFCSLVVATIWLLGCGSHWLTGASGSPHWPACIWGLICWCMLGYVTLSWAIRRWRQRRPVCLLSNDTQVLDLQQTHGTRLLGDSLTRLLASIPGNEILEIHFQHKVITVDRLPTELDGLRIAQITDLHMTGQLQREFFDAVVARTNQWEAELVVITGDLVDKDSCIAWVPPTLGQLTSQFGVYALLGNHDQRLADVGRLRQTLADCGIEDLGGRCVMRRVRGVDVLFGGNECPWFARHRSAGAARRGTSLLHTFIPFARSTSVGPQASIRSNGGRPHARGSDSLSVDRTGDMSEPLRGVVRERSVSCRSHGAARESRLVGSSHAASELSSRSYASGTAYCSRGHQIRSTKCEILNRFKTRMSKCPKPPSSLGLGMPHAERTPVCVI